MIAATTRAALMSPNAAERKANMHHALGLTEIERGATALAPLLTPAQRRRLLATLEALDAAYERKAPS